MQDQEGFGDFLRRHHPVNQPRASPGPVSNPHSTDGEATLPQPPTAEAALFAQREAAAATEGYEQLTLLGRGGMGIVYRAYSQSLMRNHALKFVVATDDELRRFKAEAAATARVQHPNIIVIHKIVTEPTPFIAYEYLSGGTLEDLASAHTLDARAAAEITLTLAEAIAQAHKEGIVHRDLKPANVLRDAGGNLKITDFGLAKFINETTRTVGAVGTPCYMAPEQADSTYGKVGPAADIYALGATLYRLLTGKPPFEGNALEVMYRLQTEEPVPPGVVQPTVPKDLGSICMICLRKTPQQRYQTAEALADDLRRFLASEPIAGRPVGALERGRSWARRNPRMAGLLAVLGLVGFALGFLLVLALNKTIEADQNYESALEVCDATLALAKDLENLRDRPEASRKMLSKLRLIYDRFAKDRAADPRQRPRMAQTEAFLGDIAKRLGDLELAQRHYAEALSRFRILAGKQGDANVAMLLGRLADVEARLGKRAEAERTRTEAMSLQESLAGLSPNDAARQIAWSDALSKHALFLRADRDRRADAGRLHRRALELAQRAHQLAPDRPEYLEAVVGMAINLGTYEQQAGRREEARAHYKFALGQLREGAQRMTLGPTSDDYHANCLYALGRLAGSSPFAQAEAETHLIQTLEIRRRLIWEFPHSLYHRKTFVDAATYALFLHARPISRGGPRRELADEAASHLRHLLFRGGGLPRYDAQAAGLNLALAYVALREQNNRLALLHLDQMIAICDRTPRDPATEQILLDWRRRALQQRAKLFQDAGRCLEALHDLALLAEPGARDVEDAPADVLRRVPADQRRLLHPGGPRDQAHVWMRLAWHAWRQGWLAQGSESIHMWQLAGENVRRAWLHLTARHAEPSGEHWDSGPPD